MKLDTLLDQEDGRTPIMEATIVGRQVRDIYSNFDHEVDTQTQSMLEGDASRFAQHSATNFCGYVWHDESGWYENVWRHNASVASYFNESLTDLIAEVNGEWGAE